MDQETVYHKQICALQELIAMGTKSERDMAHYISQLEGLLNQYMTLLVNKNPWASTMLKEMGEDLDSLRNTVVDDNDEEAQIERKLEIDGLRMKYSAGLSAYYIVLKEKRVLKERELADLKQQLQAMVRYGAPVKLIECVKMQLMGCIGAIEFLMGEEQYLLEKLEQL